ncbi:MAG: helix-turn-helix domain-containing protein [Oscillospiraceae bacterium]|nr:helix-turn-helix domain-containing protein [Oscillospiraceae bacterium]
MSDLTMGQRIAERRKMLGLSQEALGDKVGVSRQAISKWESDGAVPEIDKLIALSRLFGVSVGWLLGVEEQEATKADELNEEQLKMVEEIVRRYQPKEKEFPWFPILLIFLFLFPIVYFLFGTKEPDSHDYSGQISSLQSSYQSIQQQLSSLSGRVEDIASAAEIADELLLTYEFQFLEVTKSDALMNTPGDGNIVVDLPAARIRFTAVPKQHTESDTAWLAALLEGKPVQQVECSWDGSGYAAEADLWLADGYEYRFVLEHPDGTQQIQVLEEYVFNDLAYGTSLHCTVAHITGDYDFRTWSLTIPSCYVHASKPIWGESADARWAEAGLILYRNGEEVERRIDSVAFNALEPELIREYISHDFRGVKLEEGDEVELTFYAALDNGMSKEITVGQWTIQEGKFTELEIAE